MTSRKSIEESEMPAKNWQVEGLHDKLNLLDKQMIQMNASLQTLITRSQSQVTPQQLTENIAAVKIGYETAIKESEKDTNTKIDGLKANVKTNNRRVSLFTGAIISVAIIVVGAAALIILKGGNG